MAKTTKRANGEGSISKLKDGTYFVRVTAGLKEDGKPKIISRRAKTPTEAKQKLKELQKEAKAIQNRTTLDFSDLTVNEYFDLFLAYKKRSIKPTSFRRLESTVDEHIKKYFEYTYFDSLTADDIRNRLLDAQMQGQSYSSVKKIYEAFNGCYKFATNIKRDIPIQDNPMLAVDMIPERQFKKARTEPRILEEDERIRFVSEASRRYKNGRFVYRYGPAMLFMLYTGIRESEMCGLGRSSIHMEEQPYIDVKDSVATIKTENGYETVLDTHSTKYDLVGRYVPLNSNAQSALTMVEENFPQIDTVDRLIYSVRKTLLPPSELNKTFNRICRAANIGDMDGVGPHCLRHTFASMLFEKEVDIKIISELLGHNDVSTTQNTYISVIKKLKVKAVHLPDIS